MTNITSTKTPHGLVVIYNYKERFGDSYVGKPFDIDQVIINSGSLISITTQKSKSSPAGSFEMRLAPYKNWAAAITPGSWCVILMSNSKINDAAATGAGEPRYVDEKSFKMLGRIESVRGVVNTDQTTGARQTEYIVTGSDWGVIFNSSLYIDPLDRLPDATPIGMALRLGYAEYLEQALYSGDATTKDAPKKDPKSKDTETNKAVKALSDADAVAFFEKELKKLEKDSQESKKNPPPGRTKSGVLPNGRYNVQTILDLWGRYKEVPGKPPGILGNANHQFKIPTKLKEYMRFDSENIADLITQVSGKLTDTDKYSNTDPSIGIIHFDSIFGENNVWQVLTQNFNAVTNELIPEIRFNNGTPRLALYNRIKPFVLNSNNMVKDANRINGGKEADNPNSKDAISTANRYVSLFKRIKTIDIPKQDVIMSSFGTNWRDKVNFIEISLGKTLLNNENYAASIKVDSQFFDQRSIARDGLKSMRVTTNYMPVNGSGDAPSPFSSFAYKYLLKEIYFNTHNMFNGTLSLIGQDQYIQVGDNIMVDASVLDINNNFNQNQKKSENATYLLAHVESISHNMSYNGDFRVFTTSLNFVRGIIVDKNKNVITKNSGAIDQDASLLGPTEERNRYAVSSFTELDPDSSTNKK